MRERGQGGFIGTFSTKSYNFRKPSLFNSGCTFISQNLFGASFKGPESKVGLIKAFSERCQP